MVRGVRGFDMSYSQSARPATQTISLEVTKVLVLRYEWLLREHLDVGDNIPMPSTPKFADTYTCVIRKIFTNICEAPNTSSTIASDTEHPMRSDLFL
jgi:hypothetical protein